MKNDNIRNGSKNKRTEKKDANKMKNKFEIETLLLVRNETEEFIFDDNTDQKEKHKRKRKTKFDEKIVKITNEIKGKTVRK